MTELPGQKLDLETLRSKVTDTLTSVDSQQRRRLIRELFSQEFRNQLSPQLQQELEALAAFDNIPATETPEQKAERLLTRVSQAEFDSFQEYSYVSTRSIKGFVSTKSDDYDLHRENDIVTYSPQDSIFKNRSVLIPRSVARIIDPKLVTQYDFEGGLSNRNALYCLVGKKNGKIIVQGGGQLN